MLYLNHINIEGKIDSYDLSFDFDNNKAVMGYYYTGEVIDDFDDMYHIQAEQALYSHTVMQ